MTPSGDHASAQPRLPSLAPPRSVVRRILGPSLVLGLALATIGCESKSSTSTGPSPVKCQVSLEAASNSIDSTGGQGAITVSAQPECGWTASSDAPWITGLTPASGQGSGRVEFQAVANPAGTMRQGHIAVNGQQIPVQQQPAACRFEVSPVAPAIDAAGGAVTIAITTLAGCPWQASVDVGWVSITSTSGTGTGSVGLRVSANGGETRSAALRVAGQTVTLTQSSSTTTPPNCVFSLERTNEAVSALGGSVTVAVSGTPGCARTATSGASWITVLAGANGTGPGAVTFNVASNSGAARVGTLTIASRAFTVSQSASTSSCVYSVGPDNQSVGAAGGAGAAISISTSAGCAWTATSQTSWIALMPPTSGSGTATVTFTVSANSGGARTGTVSIAGRTLTINQAAAASTSCTFSIGSHNQSIGAAGGTGVAVAVSTAAGCAWNARSNDGWITLVSGTTGTGAGVVTFNVATNTAAARTGTLTIAGETFTVNQASGSCSYSINPTEQAINEKGGPIAVAVSAGAGCGWTATSNESWITITAGASGTGNGTVRFNVDSTGGKRRTGTLTIAGRTFTVDQDKKNGD